MRPSWMTIFGSCLVLLSLALYLAHYLIFRDAEHIFVFFLGDLAFLPVEVLLVTLVLHRLLENRERRSKFRKLNMVIGAFFSEVGTWLLAYISDADLDLEEIRSSLVVKGDWPGQEFSAVSMRLKGHSFEVSMDKVDLPSLKKFLATKRDFLLRLLENPMLLEHESFTELLHAVFHLTEELESRPRLDDLPEADLEHLRKDLMRIYRLLVMEWLDYMMYLKESYPYLFSLAMRTNPFDQSASPILR